MGEMSNRFAVLMARMAKSDADLFRTIGEQNASIRQMVDDLAVAESNQRSLNGISQLVTAGLLPSELCDVKELKARFGKLVEAQTWVESQIGKAPKKPTWAVIEQTCREGAWPVASRTKASSSKGLTAAELDQRLASFEQRLEQRLLGLEAMLRLIAEAVIRDQSVPE
jgi:hypothetical protein